MWMCHFLGQTLLHLQARHFAAASEPMDAALQDLVSRPSVKRFGIGRRGVGPAILRCLEQLALDRGVLQLQMDDGTQQG
jgi:hypothetical protein